MEKEQREYSEELGYLTDYPDEMALSMAKSKQAFVSFLLGLQNMTWKDYALLTVHEDKSKEFHRLFFEWLMRNKLFSDKELEYCPKLRTPEFMRIFKLAEMTPGFEHTFFQFMIAYSVRK
jgi:hypothetical protein